MGFIYKFESRQVPNLLNRSGASFQFLLPKEKLDLEPAKLADSVLWIVVEENGKSYLVEMGTIESVSIIEKGTHKGDYILELNNVQTVKTTNGVKDKGRWVVPEKIVLMVGFNTCPDETEREFENLFLKNFVVRVAEKEKGDQNKLKKWSMTLGRRLALHELATLTSKSSLDDLEGNTKHLDLSPIGYALFRSFYTNEKAEEGNLLETIRSIDPLLFSEKKLPIVHASEKISISVDTDLREISPDDIFSRTFVSETKMTDFDATMKKTEQAEQLHQEIVRHIVQGLINIGRKPMASKSIDVGFKGKSTTFILEVKTVDERNFVSQFQKGISQLLFYLSELEMVEIGPSKGILVLGNPLNIQYEEIFLRVANKVSIDVVEYKNSTLNAMPKDLLLTKYLND